MKNERYDVYINYPNSKAIGHVEGCPHAKVWGGHDTAAGGHIGPLGTRAEAEQVGQQSGFAFKWCGHCS